MKKNKAIIGIIGKTEKQIRKFWKAFCEEYETWETRLLECKQNSALALKEWERSKPKFDYPPKDLYGLVRDLTDGKGTVYWCWDERYVFELDNEDWYAFREHLVEVNGKAVWFIREKYYDDGRYTLDLEEAPR